LQLAQCILRQFIPGTQAAGSETSSAVVSFTITSEEKISYAENEQMWWILILPLHATSSGVFHFEWRVPLRVACATSSGVLTV